MPRIRSVHPGLFTDEDFVSMSDAAQIFFIGLLTQADDQGIFEWKPTTLKIRLRPASLEPIDGLLSELAAANRIRAYEIDGRKYGAIRNFRKFQRPKFPKALYPCPPEWEAYVRLNEAIGETEADDEPPLPKSKAMKRGGSGSAVRSNDPVGGAAAGNGPPLPKSPLIKRTRSGSATEIAAQREEGGGRREEDSSSRHSTAARAPPSRAEPDFEQKIRDLVGMEPCKLALDFHVIQSLVEVDGIAETDIVAGITTALRRGTSRFRSFESFVSWIRNEAKDRLARIPRKAPNGHAAPPSGPPGEMVYALRGGLETSASHLAGMIKLYRKDPKLHLPQWGNEADLRARTPKELKHLWDEMGGS